MAGEHIVFQQGSFRRVVRYLKGWHPELGVLHFGFSGPETIQEVHVVSAIRVFSVEDNILQ